MVKKNLFYVFVALSSLGVAYNSEAQGIATDGSNRATTAVPFLSIAPDSRSGGMGDLGVATSPDVNSQAHNVAKYAFMKSVGGVSFSYSPWLRNISDDTNITYLAGYKKINDKQGISAALRYFTLGDIKLTNNDNVPMGTENLYEFSIDLGYYMQLSEHFAGGVALRYIRSSSGTSDQNVYPGNAFASDIGFYYKTSKETRDSDETFSAGISLSNIGSKISYDNGVNKHNLPTNLGLGANYGYEFNTVNNISVGLEFNKLMASDIDQDISIIKEITTSLGAEYTYNKHLAIRAGYFYESPEAGNKQYMTLGAGIAVGGFNLDFSYLVALTENSPLANTLRFTLAFDFGSLKSRA
ncbi:MAG: type IX secretion system outer membrane channel protein PorV [Bacteroidales bacterium]